VSERRAKAARRAGRKPSAPKVPEVHVPKSPLDLMLPYQRRYHDDSSRFKAWLKARQIGGSFTSTAEPTVDCFQAEQDGRKTDWVFFSAGERQALELLDKAKQWTESFKLSIEGLEEDREHGEALLKSATIQFPGGSRIISLPANPNTARGYTANMLFDEFAFLEDSDAMWRATFPIVSNELRGKLKLRVVSSANGKDNKFHEIVTANKRFSVHKTTIYDAQKEGLPVDIEALREALGDPDGWAQEFECQFIDAAAVLLPYDLIALNEAPEASAVVPPEYWEVRNQFPIDVGIDFGRKRNLTVSWAAESVADLQITREVLCLQNMPTPDQVEILRPRIQRARRVCLDYTGPGVGMGDYLVREFGEWNPEKHMLGKIELCTFTGLLKNEVFSKLRMAFERRGWRIPISRAVREDLHSVHRITTAAGNVSYRAPMTEDGHADRATALALCTRAAAMGPSGIVDLSGIRTGRNRSRARFTPRRLRK
jgi:phage FluMu gp28-like protein